MSENNFKIVCYKEHCTKCKYEAVEETSEPCETCITEFVNRCSRTPVKFEERDK